MFKIRTILLLSLFLMSLIGCDKEKPENINLTVASKQAPFVESMINSPRYYVKYDGDKEWSLFYSHIEGFDYQEGYEYVLNVKVTTISDPPMDASSKDYKLNHVVSREEKESEHIPNWFTEGSGD